MKRLGPEFREVVVCVWWLEAETSDDGEGGIANCGECLGGIVGTDSTGVFMESDVADIVQFVFDAPMATVQFQEPFGSGFLATQAGDGMDNLNAFLVLADATPGDAADLGEAGPLVEIFGQAGAAFQPAKFEPAMSLVKALVALDVRRRRPWGRGGNPARRPGRCRP